MNVNCIFFCSRMGEKTRMTALIDVNAKNGYKLSFHVDCNAFPQSCSPRRNEFFPFGARQFATICVLHGVAITGQALPLKLSIRQSQDMAWSEIWCIERR